MTAGFQIKAQIGPSTVTAIEPFFTSTEATYQSYTAGSGETIFTSPGHSLKVDDRVAVSSTTGTNIAISIAFVTAVTASTITIDVEADQPETPDTGDIFLYDNILWNDSTPEGPFSGSEGFLREIHIQLSTTSSSVIEVTLDGGEIWLPLNNNAGLFGLATFTMFVKFDTELNFRATSPVSDVTITVTGD